MIKYGIAASLALLATLAHADGDYISPTNDRVRVSLGIMDLSSTTTLQVDSSTGTPGTVVNGEDQLGLPKDEIEPKIQAMVRAGSRNRIFFDYFKLDRTGNATLTEPIVFRDAVLQVGDPVQSLLNFRVLGITYAYSFYRSEKLEFAAMLGADSVDIQAQVKVQTAAQHVNQMKDLAGPFPAPGLDATWVLSKRFYLDARGQYLSLHFDNLDGSLSHAGIRRALPVPSQRVLRARLRRRQSSSVRQPEQLGRLFRSGQQGTAILRPSRVLEITGKHWALPRIPRDCSQRRPGSIRRP